MVASPPAAKKLAAEDPSQLRPRAYRFSPRRLFKLKSLVGPQGFEPWTNGL
jgi:hypothetical protein